MPYQRDRVHQRQIPAGRAQDALPRAPRRHGGPCGGNPRSTRSPSPSPTAFQQPKTCGKQNAGYNEIRTLPHRGDSVRAVETRGVIDRQDPCDGTRLDSLPGGEFARLLFERAAGAACVHCFVRRPHQTSRLVCDRPPGESRVIGSAVAFVFELVQQISARRRIQQLGVCVDGGRNCLAPHRRDCVFHSVDAFGMGILCDESLYATFPE